MALRTLEGRTDAWMVYSTSLDDLLDGSYRDVLSSLHSDNQTKVKWMAEKELLTPQEVEEAILRIAKALEGIEKAMWALAKKINNG